jgi:hypothetical protein
MKTTTLLPRFAIGICGGIVGAYCAYTAFRNGQMLATGLDGVAFGSAFAATVVGSWFILPLAAHSPAGRAALMRLGWALCLAFVLINAIGFTASHRTMQVGEKANSIVSYDTALKSLQEAQDRLTAMKANPRWVRTSGCTDATAEQSIEFCRQVQQAQSIATGNQAVVASGRPATADAQADTIAWATRIDTAVVSRALPIFMAVVLDIAASLFIWVAMTVYVKDEIAPVAEICEGPATIETVVEAEVAAQPAPTEPTPPPVKKQRKPRRKTTRQVNALKKIASTIDFDRSMMITKAGRPDRRFKAVRQMNDNRMASNDA